MLGVARSEWSSNDMLSGVGHKANSAPWWLLIAMFLMIYGIVAIFRDVQRFWNCSARVCSSATTRTTLNVSAEIEPKAAKIDDDDTELTTQYSKLDEVSVIYVSGGGEKFHSNDVCRGLRSRSTALKKYERCKLCSDAAR